MNETDTTSGTACWLNSDFQRLRRRQARYISNSEEVVFPMTQEGSRKISNRNGYWYISKTPDAVSGEMVVLEGSLERDFVCRLKAHAVFNSLKSQPVKIRYSFLPSGLPTDIELLDQSANAYGLTLQDDPRVKRSVYHPDCLVFWKTGDTWLIEVKSSKYVEDPEVRRKKAVGEAYAAQRGWEFYMVTDLWIRQEPQLTNARIQGRYRPLLVPHDVQFRILDAVTQFPGETIGTLADHLCPPYERRKIEPYLFALIAQHKLDVEEDKPLGPNSAVFLPREGREFDVRFI